MDSTGHIIRHRTSSERDSLFNAEMKQNWEDFNREFGQCFVSYEIPIFNSDYTYCYFEWSFACQDKGQGIRGLYKKVNNKIKKLLENVVLYLKQSGYYTMLNINIGISIYPEHGKDSETLLRNADLSMYKVKRNGKDDFKFFKTNS